MNNDYFKIDPVRTQQLNVVFTNRYYGTLTYSYYIKFRKAYAKERKKFMGEIILTLSIALILTVASSFWLGYSYGKLRAIKSYEAKQIATYEEYLNANKGATNENNPTE